MGDKIHINLWKGFTCYPEYRRNSRITNKSQHNLRGTLGFNGHLSKHDTQKIKFSKVLNISNPHGNTH